MESVPIRDSPIRDFPPRGLTLQTSIATCCSSVMSTDNFILYFFFFKFYFNLVSQNIFLLFSLPQLSQIFYISLPNQFSVLNVLSKNKTKKQIEKHEKKHRRQKSTSQKISKIKLIFLYSMRCVFKNDQLSSSYKEKVYMQCLCISLERQGFQIRLRVSACSCIVYEYIYTYMYIEIYMCD